MTPIEKIGSGLGMIIIALILVAVGPLFALWGWNQLFSTFHTFEYTFWNWLAVIAISGVFKVPYASKRNYN